MASKGLKRPLGPDSVPSEQPIADSDDDLSSPECFLPLQPVEDDYSSDDEARKKLRLVKTDNGESNRIDLPIPTHLALHKTSHGQDIKAEQSYFYTDVHFQKIGEEVCLEDKSLEECLEYLFKFSSSRFFDEQRCTWNGEKLTDITESNVTSSVGKWLTENDNIDWKTASPEKRSEVEKFYDQFRYNRTLLFKTNDDTAFNVAVKTKKLYDVLCLEGTLSSDKRCFIHQTITTCIASLALCISPSQYVRSGSCDCELRFPLYVPDDVVTDDSPLIPEGRQVVITNRPDGVFTFYYDNEELWLVPIELYVPSAEKEVEQHKFSPTAVSPQLGFSPVVNQQATCPQNAVLDSPSGVQRKDQILASPATTSAPMLSKGSKVMDEVSSLRDPMPPKTSLNSLLNPEYVEAARTHIAESLPVHCRMPHCLDKMAGQHVQQLLVTATQITIEQKSYFEEGVLEILGLFVVNEYVYFSRLDIPKKLTYFFSVGLNLPPMQRFKANMNKHIKDFRELDPPSVSYSNFRLDLTIAKHRLALMIFMRRYIHAFFNVKM